MFNRFADGARTAVVLAQEEARELGDRRIGPAHLMLGVAGSTGAGSACLVAAGLDQVRLRPLLARGAAEGLDAEALASVGIDLDEVQASAEASFGEGALGRHHRPKMFGHVPFTRGAKAALEQALRSALRLGDRGIGTGHVLLGVLAVDDEVVRAVLRVAGVDPVDLAADAERRLRAAAA